jgi:outer membrane lipoprotein-sorting protein
MAILIGSLLAKGKTSFLPKSFHATFIKEEKSAISQKVKKNEGELFYQYPSRIRMEASGKRKTIYVSNPFQTYLYTPPVFDDVPGELTINKSKNTPMSKFFDSLKKGLVSNKIYKVKKKGERVLLTFTALGEKEMKIHSAELKFQGKKEFSRLKEVQIVLDNKKKMLFKFQKIAINQTLKEGLFEFDAPKNTRISR